MAKGIEQSTIQKKKKTKSSQKSETQYLSGKLCLMIILTDSLIGQEYLYQGVKYWAMPEFQSLTRTI